MPVRARFAARPLAERQHRVEDPVMVIPGAVGLALAKQAALHGLVDRNKARPRLDQPPRQQHALAVNVQAVALAQGERFAAQVGCLLHGAAGQRGDGGVEYLVVNGQRLALRLREAAEVVNLLNEGVSILEAFARHGQAANAEAGIAWIAVDVMRAVSWPKVTGRRGVAGVHRQTNVGGNAWLADAAQRRVDAAEVREVLLTTRQHAAHDVLRRLVVPAADAAPRPDDGNLVHPPCQQRHLLRDKRTRHAGRSRLPQAADSLRRVRLGVPGLEVADAAGQEEKDTRNVAARRRDEARSGGLEIPRQRQAKHADADLQGFPSR